MNEIEDKKINKREHWEDQIRKWKESNLKQSEYCRQEGIKHSTFGYWLKELLDPALKKEKNNKFIPVKMIKDVEPTNSNKLIKIKLLTGHMIYLPIEMDMSAITQLIQSLR